MDLHRFDRPPFVRRPAGGRRDERQALVCGSVEALALHRRLHRHQFLEQRDSVPDRRSRRHQRPAERTFGRGERTLRRRPGFAVRRPAAGACRIHPSARCHRARAAPSRRSPRPDARGRSRAVRPRSTMPSHRLRRPRVRTSGSRSRCRGRPGTPRRTVRRRRRCCPSARSNCFSSARTRLELRLRLVALELRLDDDGFERQAQRRGRRHARQTRPRTAVRRRSRLDRRGGRPNPDRRSIDTRPRYCSSLSYAASRASADGVDETVAAQQRACRRWSRRWRPPRRRPPIPPR